MKLLRIMPKIVYAKHYEAGQEDSPCSGGVQAAVVLLVHT